jgi:hypothetical protein
MRRLLGCAFLFLLTCASAQTSPPKEWLAFQEQFQAFAAGPTGLYSAQDMQELNPGDSMHLPSAQPLDKIRWIKGTAGDTLATIEYKNNQLMLSGPGLAPSDLLQVKGRQLPLPGGLIVKASSFRDQTLKLWLYNPGLPAQRQFKGLAYFPYDPQGEVRGSFRRNEVPVPVSYLDSRGQQGVMYDVGSLEVQIEGKPYSLKAFSYKKSWGDIDELLVLLKDRTSGKTTYGGGRVVDVSISKDSKGAPPEKLTVNLNMAYSFLCAHSSFYNCPLVLTSYVDADLNFGEKYPPL